MKDILDFTKYAYLMEANRRIYFVGIAGISMSGLAELALSRGQVVAGSDMAYNDRCEHLEDLGAKVFSQHSEDHIEEFQPDALVFSAAIPSDNPELTYARANGIPTIERSDWLGLLNREFPEVINIAGTHGKSTTTSMCAYILMDAGLDPTVHLGAELDRFRSTVHTGGQKLMLSEACEFNYSFFSFDSEITSVLNIAHDHLDLFPEIEDVIFAFAQYISLQKAGTKLVLPSFDPHVGALLDELERIKPGHLGNLSLYFFGYPEDKVRDYKTDLIIEEIEYEHGLPYFSLSYQGRKLGKFKLAIPGRFNVENAAAAILVSYLAGASFETAKESLAKFKGAEGRFTICGYYNGALVINDYAHHPDSVKQTIQAAAEIPHKRIIPCFQAIGYSRAKGLAEGFIEALKDYEHAIVVEVFDDREKDRSFSAEHIVREINRQSGSARFIPTLEELELVLRHELQEGDIVILMGQNIRQIGDKLASRSNHYDQHYSLDDSPQIK